MGGLLAEMEGRPRRIYTPFAPLSNNLLGRKTSRKETTRGSPRTKEVFPPTKRGPRSSSRPPTQKKESALLERKTDLLLGEGDPEVFYVPFCRRKTQCWQTRVAPACPAALFAKNTHQTPAIPCRHLKPSTLKKVIQGVRRQVVHEEDRPKQKKRLI